MLSMKISHSVGPQKSSAMKKPPRSGIRAESSPGNRSTASGRSVRRRARASLHPAFVEIHGLFHRSGRGAASTAQGQHEMAVGARVILGPHGVAFAPQTAAAKTEAASAARDGDCGYIRRQRPTRSSPASHPEARCLPRGIPRPEIRGRATGSHTACRRGQGSSQRLGKLHVFTPSVRISPARLLRCGRWLRRVVAQPEEQLRR